MTAATTQIFEHFNTASFKETRAQFLAEVSIGLDRISNFGVF